MADAKKVVLTYGTFDLFHIGHLRLLKRAKALGDILIVGVSTNEFNEIKGKKALFPYEQRAEIVKSIKYVDMVIPEKSWDQKVSDIEKTKSTSSLWETTGRESLIISPNTVRLFIYPALWGFRQLK